MTVIELGVEGPTKLGHINSRHAIGEMNMQHFISVCIIICLLKSNMLFHR